MALPSRGGNSYCSNEEGCGTIYAVTLAGAEKVLHTFWSGDASDGMEPQAGLAYTNGAFYGTTPEGGTYQLGTIYEIRPSGTYKVIHSVSSVKQPSGKEDILYPNIALMAEGKLLYGGGTSGTGGLGGVFRITTAGVEKTLYNFKFDTTDGYPTSGRLLYMAGAFYGVASQGGAYGNGTIFSVNPKGKETVLYSFKGGTDGAYPLGNLVDVGGTLYGTTYRGGAPGFGTIFQVTTAGVESVVHTFSGGTSDGESPEAGLLNVSGTLYGTTVDGGLYHGGVVFKLVP